MILIFDPNIISEVLILILFDFNFIYTEAVICYPYGKKNRTQIKQGAVIQRLVLFILLPKTLNRVG